MTFSSDDIDIFSEHQNILFWFKDGISGGNHKIINSCLNDKEHTFSICTLNPLPEVMRIHISFCIENDIGYFYHKIELLDGESLSFRDSSFNSEKLKENLNDLVNGKEDV